MGKIKNNDVTKGFSGRFGDDIMFRQIGGKTYFSKRTLTTVAPSALQIEMRYKFTEASLFGADAVKDPEASQHYKVMAVLQGLRSAYVAAVTDYLTVPEIDAVFTHTYRGRAGDLITIMPKVMYKINEITVTIRRPDGTVLESGKAIARELKWCYIASSVNPEVRGSRLVLTARDRQGKESTFEKVL